MDDRRVIVRRVTFGLRSSEIGTLLCAGEHLSRLADEAEKIATAAWGNRRPDANKLYEDFCELACASAILSKVADAMCSDEDDLRS